MVKKTSISLWFKNIVQPYMNSKEIKTFLIHYIDDNVAYDYLKKLYIDKEKKNNFEKYLIECFTKKTNICFKQDTYTKKTLQNKGTFCCNTNYRGNKKKCNICGQNLKF